LAFPETHRSVVLAVRSADQQERARALEAVVTAYWRPVFRHVRARWRVPDEEAEHEVERFRDFLDSVDPEDFGHS
jgi:hypothetical protein